MSFKQIRNFIASLVADKNTGETTDDNRARMTREEVLKIALAVAREEQWTHMKPRDVYLWRNEETKRLIWSVEFMWNWVEEEYVTGAMGAVKIDDATGKILDKRGAPH